MRLRRLFGIEWLVRALLVVATVVVAICALMTKPVRNGDGPEYFFQTYQFSRHMQLSGTKADLYSFAEWFKPVGELYCSIEQIPKYPDGRSFTRIGDRYFPHHFGFYSALASVPATVLRALHLNEHKALNITNGMLFIAMLWGVWLLWPFSRGVGLAYMICLAFSPGALYLTWPHPEVYICAFVTLSLVSAMGGRLKLATLFASFASLQNQVLGIYLVALGLLFIRQEALAFRIDRRVRWREWGLMVLAGLPSLLPIMYYLLNIGSPTLLGGMVYTSTAFMSLQRAWSVLTDLNQGVVVASVPVVLLLFWFCACHLFGYKVRCAWMLGVTFMLCYGVTSIVNWNSGCNGTMRYATWIYCFALTFVAANVDVVRGKGLRVVLLVVLTVATTAQFACLPCRHCELRECARYVLTHFPSLYSPEPDVFLSRTAGTEHILAFRKPENVWGVFVDEKDRIRKVLSSRETLLSRRNVEYYVRDEDAFEKVVSQGRLPLSKLRYFDFYNDEIGLMPKTPVKFSSHCPHNVRGFDVRDMRGFASPEPWGVWSASQTCSFLVRLPQNKHGFRLALNAWPFVGVKRVSVSANGQKLADWRIAARPFEAADYEFHLPGDLTGRMIRLVFDQDKLVSPSEVNKSSHDERKLGLGFISLRIIGS